MFKSGHTGSIIDKVPSLNSCLCFKKMSLIKRKPSISWSQYYERKLFDMWEKNIRDLGPESGLKNVEMYKMMARKLDKAGFIGIEWQAVRTKLDNIIRKFRAESKEPVSNWIHFERISRILRYWKPRRSYISVSQGSDKRLEDNKTEYEETEYLSDFLDVKSEILEEKCDEPSWEHTMDLLSDSGSQYDVQSPKERRSAAQDEMTAFEAGMLAATRERNKELKKMREEITYLGRRRLGVLERLEKTMNRMAEANSKFHKQMLDKKS